MILSTCTKIKQELTDAELNVYSRQIVLDGLDRPEPRYIVNRSCNNHKIPYVFGAAIEAFGNVATIVPDQSFCLERGFHIITSGVCGITFEQSEGVTTSILKSGTMIVQTSPRLEGNLKDEVLKTYRSILVGDLGLSSAILPIN